MIGRDFVGSRPDSEAASMEHGQQLPSNMYGPVPLPAVGPMGMAMAGTMMGGMHTMFPVPAMHPALAGQLAMQAGVMMMPPAMRGPMLAAQRARLSQQRANKAVRMHNPMAGYGMMYPMGMYHPGLAMAQTMHMFQDDEEEEEEEDAQPEDAPEEDMMSVDDEYEEPQPTQHATRVHNNDAMLNMYSAMYDQRVAKEEVKRGRLTTAACNPAPARPAKPPIEDHPTQTAQAVEPSGGAAAPAPAAGAGTVAIKQEPADDATCIQFTSVPVGPTRRPRVVTVKEAQRATPTKPGLTSGVHLIWPVAVPRRPRSARPVKSRARCPIFKPYLLPPPVQQPFKPTGVSQRRHVPLRAQIVANVPAELLVIPQTQVSSSTATAATEHKFKVPEPRKPSGPAVPAAAGVPPRGQLPLSAPTFNTVSNTATKTSATAVPAAVIAAAATTAAAARAAATAAGAARMAGSNAPAAAAAVTTSTATAAAGVAHTAADTHTGAGTASAAAGTAGASSGGDAGSAGSKPHPSLAVAWVTAQQQAGATHSKRQGMSLSDLQYLLSEHDRQKALKAERRAKKVEDAPQQCSGGGSGGGGGAKPTAAPSSSAAIPVVPLTSRLPAAEPPPRPAGLASDAATHPLIKQLLAAREAAEAKQLLAAREAAEAKQQKQPRKQAGDEQQGGDAGVRPPSDAGAMVVASITPQGDPGRAGSQLKAGGGGAANKIHKPRTSTAKAAAPPAAPKPQLRKPITKALLKGAMQPLLFNDAQETPDGKLSLTATCPYGEFRGTLTLTDR